MINKAANVSQKYVYYQENEQKKNPQTTCFREGIKFSLAGIK